VHGLCAQLAQLRCQCADTANTTHCVCSQVKSSVNGSAAASIGRITDQVARADDRGMDTNMAVRDASGTPQFVVRANPLGQQTEAKMKPPIRIGIFDQYGDKQVRR
jgi:hypothetical protein